MRSKLLPCVSSLRVALFRQHAMRLPGGSTHTVPRKSAERVLPVRRSGRVTVPSQAIWSFSSQGTQICSLSTWRRAR